MQLAPIIPQTVRNFTNFGVFVEIEEGVDGLIHISDLSWTKKIKHPSEFTSIGAEIEVQVLDIDKENRRLSLGHKQLEENPWDVFETIFTVDSIHEGTVIDLFDKGARNCIALRALKDSLLLVTLEEGRWF